MTKTVVKITAMDLQDDNLLVGCENSSKDVLDAIISLLNNEICIEHKGRTLEEVTLVRDI